MRCHHIFCDSSIIASPICQEGQSARTFPIIAFSSRFFFFFPDFCLFFPIFPDFSLFFPIFGNFFAVRGGTLPPLSPQWLRHYVMGKIKACAFFAEKKCAHKLNRIIQRSGMHVERCYDSTSMILRVKVR